MRPFSLYVHIPYCFHKCPYCDFNTYAVSTIPEGDYLNAVLSELDASAYSPPWRGRSVQTIFFGGGTPSLISPAGIKRVLNSVASLFPVARDVEISLEANPGTITFESLSGYRAAGVNRLSIGAQSFQPHHLKFLGRLHSADDIEAGVRAARDAGFKNLNVDLMHGLPQQTERELLADIEKAAAFEPEHISAYGLTIEKGTPLHASFARGTFQLPKEERLVALLERLNSTLTTRGFVHYEISNFARPGYEARHNLAYWNSDDYLGIGAGAHSCIALERGHEAPLPRRWSNVAAPAKYIKLASTHGRAVAWEDDLDFMDALFDYVYLAFRKRQGLSLMSFRNRFGVTFESIYAEPISMLERFGYLVCSNDHVRISERGLLIADSVIGEFASPDLSNPARTPIVWPEEPGALAWASNI